MENIKLNIPELNPIYNFTVIYKGKDGITEIKTSKNAFLQKLKYFNQRYNELYATNECFIHDKYEIIVFKSFIESILSSEIDINKNTISKYYELSCKYQYSELQNLIKKLIEEQPDFLENESQISIDKDQEIEEQPEFSLLKEELIAQNLDSYIQNGFLKKLPIKILNRILNSPKRQIIDHRLLFNFIIDRIKCHENHRTNIDEEKNLAILTCSLDYTKMSENEINELFSLGQNLSIFHPINAEERIKAFITDSAKYQSKISELETLLMKLISKEEENEKKILCLEQKFISKEEQGDMKINIKRKDLGDKLDIINVKSTSTIKDIIKDYMGSDNYDLTYNGIILDPKLTLKDYFIQNHSIIYCIEKNNNNIIVFIKKNSDDYIPISINPNSQVNDLMNKIPWICQDDNYNLIYKGRKLEKNENLQDFSMTNQSTLSISPSINTIDINIHFIGDEAAKYTEIITVDLTDQINIIESKMGKYNIYYIDCEKVYFFNGKRLDYDKKFQDYLITNGSDILLYLKCFNIDINILGKTVNIPGNGNIKDLKLKIQEKTGIPWNEQKLFVEQKELNDCLPIPISLYSFMAGNYNFCHFPEGSKLIYVKFETNIGNCDGFIVCKDILPIKAIWQKLHELTYLSYLQDAPLVFNGKVLDKNKTLEDYNILYESGNVLKFTVQFEYQYNGYTQIFVKTFEGKHLTICCKLTDTIGLIKYNIAVKSQKYRHMRLIFAGKQLEDDNTLQYYGIQKDHIISEVLRLRG